MRFKAPTTTSILHQLSGTMTQVRFSHRASFAFHTCDWKIGLTYVNVTYASVTSETHCHVCQKSHFDMSTSNSFKYSWTSWGLLTFLKIHEELKSETEHPDIYH